MAHRMTSGEDIAALRRSMLILMLAEQQTGIPLVANIYMRYAILLGKQMKSLNIKFNDPTNPELWLGENK